MNRRFYITALLLAFVMAAFGQSTEEQKKKINSIKKSKSYLYAEITTNDQQTANDLAEDMLNQEINKYVAEQKKLRNAANIVLRNRNEVMESISLPRGNMFRAFKYVKKDDIIPADKVEVRTNQGTTVDASGTPVAVTTPTPAQSEASAKRTETINKLLAITKFSELSGALTQLKQEGRIGQYAKVFPILMGSFFCLSTTYVFGTLLTANGSLKQLNLVAAAGVLINILLNLIVIPRFQSVGAACTSLCVQAITAFAQYLLCERIFKLKLGFQYWMHLMLFMASVIVSTWVLKRLVPNPYLAFGAGFLINIGLIFITKLLRLKDLINLVIPTEKR